MLNYKIVDKRLAAAELVDAIIMKRNRTECVVEKRSLMTELEFAITDFEVINAVALLRNL